MDAHQAPASLSISARHPVSVADRGFARISGRTAGRRAPVATSLAAGSPALGSLDAIQIL